MWGPSQFCLSELRNEQVVISCGDEGMETDLVFCASYDDKDHPQTKKQREIAEYIVAAVKEKFNAAR